MVCSIFSNLLGASIIFTKFFYTIKYKMMQSFIYLAEAFYCHITAQFFLLYPEVVYLKKIIFRMNKLEFFVL